MSVSRIAVLFVMIACCFSVVYAGDLIAPEAVNYFNAGIKAQKGKNYVEAEGNYKKVFIVDPNSIKWQVLIANNRGVMLAESGDLESAETQFNYALRLKPDFSPAKLNIGFINEKRRTELESIKYWLKVLNIDLEKAKPKGFVLGEVGEDQPKTGSSLW